MPTNLPPEATEAERRYREATAIADKIACLQEFLSLIPKHKGTDKLRGDLRKRLSKLQAEAQSSKGRSRTESAYRIDREGAGQVVVIGAPNVGKSALVGALTSASPEVSEAPYTTWEPMPGMMPVEDIQVQLIDTPPLNPDYVENELMDLIRRADLVLLMVDLQAEPLTQLEEAVALIEEHRIVPAHRRDRPEETGRRLFYVPILVLANKCDDADGQELYEIFCALLEEEWPTLPISTKTGYNLERLKKEVFDRLGIIRIYSKPPGKPPDLTAPYVMKTGSTIEDLAGKVHKDFLANLKSARVWGSGAFDGQMVGRDHVLRDGDVVELRM